MTVFRKKKQLQRKKFLFLTENNVILIPFTNVHFTEVKTLESKWNWLYFLYLWSYT